MRESYCVSHYAGVKSRVTESIMRNYMAISIIRAQGRHGNNKSADYSCVDSGPGNEGYRREKKTDRTREKERRERKKERKNQRERKMREKETETPMAEYSHLPGDVERHGVGSGLAGEHHICATHIPVIVIADYCHLRGIWRRDRWMSEGRRKREKIERKKMGYTTLSSLNHFKA